jgi:hypothetical protein
VLTAQWELNCGGDRTVDREVWLAQQVATSWLLGRAYGSDPELPAAYSRFTGRPHDEQRSLLAAARADVVTCGTDALRAILR